MKKKLLSVILSVFVITLNAVSVFASEYTGDGQASIPVSLTIPSSYTVSVPASISLAYNSEGSNYEGKGEYKIKGMLAPDQYVELSFGNPVDGKDSFTLTGSKSGATITAITEFSKGGSIWTTSRNSADISSALSTTVSTFGLDYTDMSDDAELKIACPLPSTAESYSGNSTLKFSIKSVTLP